MAEGAGSGEQFVPARYQPPLPRERLILPHDAPGAGDRTELDALIVGAGPAGLACGIELARLARAGGVDLTIGVLERAEALGELSLSGAVVNPRPFRGLFPDLKDSDFPFRGPVTKEAVYLLTANGQWRLPIPPTMRNLGYYVASLCEIVRWLGHKAEELGATVFTGFPAAGLLVDGEHVAGVRTAPRGLDRDGQRLGSYQAPNDIAATVTALAEGTRSSGGRRRSRKGATTRCRSAATARASSSWATRPGSWTSPRSKGSTTRCSRASTPRARSSRRFTPGTARSSLATTAWWTTRSSCATCTVRGTCGSPSRTGSTPGGSKPVS